MSMRSKEKLLLSIDSTIHAIYLPPVPGGYLTTIFLFTSYLIPINIDALKYKYTHYKEITQCRLKWTMI